MENRKFKGLWIPKEIYLSKEVCWTAKIIFSEIDSFTSKGEDCFFSNTYLSELLDIGETQVSKHLSKLIELGWIKQTSFDGRKRYLESCLAYGFSKADLALKPKQMTTKSKGRGSLKAIHNNTLNNTVNNKEIIKENKVLNIEEKKLSFRNELHEYAIKHSSKYPNALFNEFYKWWSESDGKTQIRRDKEKFFEIGQRLATWWSKKSEQQKSEMWKQDEQESVKTTQPDLFNQELIKSKSFT